MPSSRRAGFSKGEMLALTAVLVTLSVLGMQRLSTRTVADQRTTTIQRMTKLEQALRDYAVDSGGAFPSTKQGLAALREPAPGGLQPPRWAGPYLRDNEALNDGWGVAFSYTAPGNGHPPRCYDLWSNGADGREGGTGADADICSWDRGTQLP